jgi:class 3 adenylate cyclase
MAAAGLPVPRSDHAEVIADFALAMLDVLDAVNTTIEVLFQIRIGIHTGPVVAGVIGSQRFLCDIWGEAVNLASCLESHGLPGRKNFLTGKKLGALPTVSQGNALAR